MKTLYLVLLIIGAVCFAVATVGGTIHPRINLLALGLLAWILVPLIELTQVTT